MCDGLLWMREEWRRDERVWDSVSRIEMRRIDMGRNRLDGVSVDWMSITVALRR